MFFNLGCLQHLTFLLLKLLFLLFPHQGTFAGHVGDGKEGAVVPVTGRKHNGVVEKVVDSSEKVLTGLSPISHIMELLVGLERDLYLNQLI